MFTASFAFGAVALRAAIATLEVYDREDAFARIQGAGEIRGEIRKALAKMSPKSAEVFILRYFEGYGNHEIARMLGASRSTINVILHRTRQKLREEIASYVGEKS